MPSLVNVVYIQCVNLQPHYEKVARLFNGADAVHPGVVLMTRVDCAIKVLGAIFLIYRDNVYLELSFSVFLLLHVDRVSQKLGLENYILLGCV